MRLPAGLAATCVLALAAYSLGHDQGIHQATGIAVKLDDNCTGPLLIQIEASKNNPS